MSETRHPERLEGVDKRLVALVTLWGSTLDFDRTIIEGVRSAATVAANYAKGRTQGPDGVWYVTDPKEIVTYARDPAQSPHCHGGAIDCMPLLDGVVVWSGPGWSEVLSMLQEMARAARSQGLVWGGDWTRIKDLDHFEVADWKSLPLATP